MRSKTWLVLGLALIVLGIVGLVFWNSMRSKADEEILNCPVVALYGDENYGQMGPYGCFRVGQYDRLASYDFIGEYGLSAVQVRPGYKVTLYKGERFTGESLVLTADVPDLATKNFNNVTNSAIVAPLVEPKEAVEKLNCSTVAIYAHSNYGERGAAECLPIGEYKYSYLVNSDLAGDDDRAISAVTVASGYQVALYKEDNFSGESIVIKTDTPELRSSNFNNITKSLKVAKVTDSNANMGGTGDLPAPIAPQPAPETPVSNSDTPAAKTTAQTTTASQTNSSSSAETNTEPAVDAIPFVQSGSGSQPAAGLGLLIGSIVSILLGLGLCLGNIFARRSSVM